MIDNRRGNMPFAVIAISILLLASVAGAVMAEHKRSESGVEEMMDGRDAIESSLDDVESYVNQELGIIILELSRDDSLGTMDRRADVFKDRAERWIDDRFPMRSGSVTIRLESREVMLTAESMEIMSDGSVLGGYTPSYLHGKGTIVVQATSDYGRTSKELEISTDGSYALPLAAEQGSLFERMVGGNGISVAQMMTYELQSLAQCRVLNGFGAKSQYGKNGTESIITRQDVEDAYRNAIEMIGILCFRDSDGNILDDVDMASLMTGDRFYLNLSAFYGQVLMSVMDDLVLKWYDYLCGDVLLDAIDAKFRPYRVALDALVRFVTGEDPFSAEGYIERVMESNGIDPNVYRTPGYGTTQISLGDSTITVDNPVSDVMDKDWIRYFNVHYSGGRNYIRDTVTTVLNSAAEKLFSGSGYVEIILDNNDPRPMISKISEALRISDYDIDLEFRISLISAINSENSYDPFYSEIADTVMRHAEELVDEEELRKRISESLTDIYSESDVDSILSSVTIDDAIHRYRSKVLSDLSVYDALRKVEGGGSNILLDSMAQMASYGLSLLALTESINDVSETLLDEIVDNMGINPYSGLLDLPGTDCFLLMDGSDNITRESLTFSYANDPIVYEPVILTDKCTHVTGFKEDLSAAYSTTFSVRLDDVIDYHVESFSAYSNAMESGCTGAISDTVRNSIYVEISVGSAWALAGVHYSASNTIIDDALQALWSFLEPLMEPLRKMLEMVMDVIDVFNRSVMEISRYVSEAMMNLMDRMNGPMEVISAWIDYNVEKFLEENMIDVFVRLNLSEQSFGFEYMGYTFKVKLDIASLQATTKTLFVASLSGPIAGMDTEVSISLKSKGALNGNNLYVIGKAAVTGDDWKMKITIDPLMKGSKHLATISAIVQGVDISAVLPDLEDYNEIGFTLSRIPGIGDALQNIPVPMLGINIGLDAGLSLKYTIPSAKGLIINEFETNPPGTDNGAEWVELLNNTSEEIDLTDYTLIASSDRSKKKMTLSGSIAPGEYLLIYPTFSMVNNAGKLTKNGEGLTLKDPDGNVVDKTGVRKDNSDDNKTWQRSYDGSSQWEFKESTMGASNGSYLSAKFLTAEVAKELVLDSLHDAFNKVEAVTDFDSLQEVLNETVKSAIETVIKKISGCLVEASVFVKVDIKDMTSTASAGIRVALRCDSDLAEDVLKYIAGNLEEMALSIKNPYKIDAVSMFTDNIDLEITYDTKIQYPGIFSRAFEELPEADLGITFRTNISALTQIFGEDTGKPWVECGMRFIDCPTAAIPARMSPKSGMNHDLWLIRMNITWE